MKYGYTKDKMTVVGAATTVMDFEGWYQEIAEGASGLFSARKETDFMTHLTDPEFKGYLHPAYIFEHTSNDERDAFIEKNEITVVTKSQVKDRMLDMMALADESLRSGFDLRDERTIGELSGLDDADHDPWDRRSEEEKAQADAQEKRTDELRKRLGDHVTGQSFDPNPRGGAAGGLNINEIFDGGDGSINVKGRKFGDSSKTADPLKGVADMMKNIIGGKKKDEISDELIDSMSAKLAEVGYSEEEIEAVKKNFDFTDNDHRKQFVDIVGQEHRKKKLADALSPVEGNLSREEILSTVEQRLSEIDGITAEEMDGLMGAVAAKLDQPMPKPDDYRFAVNHKLTAEPAFRGEGTPIFNFGKNQEGTNKGNFGISDLPLLLPKDSGFDMVSGHLYEFTGGSIEDGRAYLTSRGFIEDPDLLEEGKVEIKKVDTTYVPTPEDFAKVLAGNGTSTASVTDSWGRIEVGMTSDPEMEYIEPGIQGERGAVLDQFDGVKTVAFDDLPFIFKTTIGTALQEMVDAGKVIKMGNYNGVNIANSDRYPVMETGTHKIRDDISGNIKDFGGVRVGDVTTRIIARANNRYKGAVVFEAADEVIILLV